MAEDVIDKEINQDQDRWERGEEKRDRKKENSREDDLISSAVKIYSAKGALI